MEQFTLLVRPQQFQVQIDAAPKECPSEGFNYPTFRLINKQGRVNLSPEPLNPESSNAYRLFAVANLRGWFAAVTRQSSGSFSLVCSPLADLRSAFKSAKDDSQEVFVPKRTISLESGRPNILAFACNDTRLFVGLEQGQLLVYDTESLFSAGSDTVTPSNIHPDQSGPIRQIAPNPGIEPNLSDIIAVVRSNGSVALFNTKLESQGGWAAGDAAAMPVAVAWSPKGKHIAIGLQSGDILTYPLNNKTSPHKHIPPTAHPPLVSLIWLAPGHTFKTTYRPAAGGNSDACQHIVSLDAKSSTGTYVTPNHPFPLPDRNPEAFTIVLPRWDEDVSSNVSKSLVVVGDRSSIDLEVLGNNDAQWHHQSQENPLTLPLDKNMDDTMLLSLDVDLTDTSSSFPHMYAYLNDGTLQGWVLEHTKAYAGIIFPQAVSASFEQASTPATGQPSFGEHSTFPSSFGRKPPGSTFPPTPAFGTSGFDQQPTPVFGQASQPVPAFGKPQTSSAFGGAVSASPFGQQATGPSASGQPSQPVSAFGSTTVSTPAFGSGVSTSAFGSGSAFGSTSFGSTSPTAFGGASSTSPFGSTFGPSSAATTTIGNAFSAFSNKSGANNAFGQASFGFGTPTPAPSAAEMTREESMADDTGPSFGGLSLGGGSGADTSKAPKAGIFGALPAAPPASMTTPTTSSAFGASTIKPATGFGAFSNFKSTETTEPTKPSTETTTSATAFGTSKPASQPSFGTSSFGQPSFGQPAFGQPAFGQTGFGKPAATAATTTSSGGFAAFAVKPATFGGAAAQQTSSSDLAFGAAAKLTSPTGGGFQAFASATPGAFGAAAGNGPAFGAASATSGFGSGSASPFAPAAPSEPSKSPFALTSTATAPFGVSTSASPFGVQASTSPFARDEPSTAKKPFASPSPSPVSTPRLGSATIDSENESPPPPPAFKTPSTTSSFGTSTTPTTTPAFSNIQTSTSMFKPASGFGAFGSDKTPSSSPFFKAAAEPKTPSVSAFGTTGLPSTTTPPSAVAAATPMFGSSSSLGGFKSPFSPASPTPATGTAVKAPVSGGFGAFSGSPSGFSAFAGPKKSFGELLKDGGDKGATGATKPATAFGAKKEEKMKETPQAPSIPKTAPVSAFDPAPVFSPPKKEEAEKEGEQAEQITAPGEAKAKTGSDESFASLSLSTASSFAEVEHEPVSEEEVASGSEDAEGEAQAESDDEYIYEEESEESYSSSSELSDVPEEGETLEAEGSEKDERSSLSSPPEPTNIPLPESRSRSATPQLEVPKIRVTPSPSPTESSVSDELSAIRERSTTPPDTPVKEPSPPLKSSPTPPPTTSPSPPAFGLGRPSTRPTRSSPLASTPVSLEDEEEDDKTAVPVPVVRPEPVVAKPIEVPLKEEEEESKVRPTRPKTPPLLSTLGSPSPPIPETPTLKPMPSPYPVASPAPFSLFVKRKAATPEPSPLIAASPPPASIFGEPSKPTVFAFGGGSGAAAARATASSASFIGAPLAPAKPATAPSTSVFGGSASAPSTTPAISFSPFTLTGKPEEKKPASAPASLFPSAAPTPAPVFGASWTSAKPATTTTAPVPFGLGPFNLKDKAPEKPAPSEAPLLFRKPAGPPQTPQALKPRGLSLTTPSPPKPPPEATMEEGLQKECARLVFILTQELASLKQLAEAGQKRIEMTKSLGGSRHRVDLGNPEKWALDDVMQFGQVLLQFEKELVELREQRDAQKQTLREIQSNMLKAVTRKEEISRFNKAKTDKEFSKMLKSRTLGPEHLETQTQLRRSIRTIRDRITKLEENLKACKKRLNERKSGRPSLKAPSLDTINRTYRNIDLAIQQQADDVARLTLRLSKLKLSTSSKASASTNGRDARLPDPVARPYSVTPHVAVTTAAALNAERSAHRLKRALLSVRPEPLLNTKAKVAPPAPIAFTTPQKAPLSDSNFAFKVPLSTPLFSSSGPGTPNREGAQQALNWTLPEDHFNPATPPAVVKRGATVGAKRHSPGVPLKLHTPGQQGGFQPSVLSGQPAAPSSTPPSFSWGPLPTFKTTSTTMVETVKLTPPKTATMTGSPWGK